MISQKFFFFFFFLIFVFFTKQTKHGMARSTCWVFTLNNDTADEHIVLEGLFGNPLTTVFASVGKEWGDSGTPHLQGFVQWKNPQTLHFLKRPLPRIHAEIKARRSTIVQAVKYTQKDGTYVTWGTHPPDCATQLGRRRSPDTDEADLACAKDGRIDDVSCSGQLRYWFALKDMARKSIFATDELRELNNIWVWGFPGCGKSHWARHAASEWNGVFVKNSHDTWWTLYRGEECIIFDDVDRSSDTRELKVIADKYPATVRVHGGHICIRPRCVIVTSNYPISMIARTTTLTEALERRFHEIRMVFENGLRFFK